LSRTEHKHAESKRRRAGKKGENEIGDRQIMLDNLSVLEVGVGDVSDAT